uniref:3-keto-disaccharide hydrolase domain-containing protein n=1 Tax=Thermosporothrix sp. COM3 TaxID=2490863 RepID=A0A455SHH1_9CHLR|nr:hypothetical protein KTC_15690 [Thermosporothrix sp. COM3]
MSSPYDNMPPQGPYQGGGEYPPPPPGQPYPPMEPTQYAPQGGSGSYSPPPPPPYQGQPYPQQQPYQQPNYAPGMQPPFPPPQKRNNNGLIIGCVVALVIVLVAGIGLVVWAINQPDDNRKTDTKGTPTVEATATAAPTETTTTSGDNGYPFSTNQAFDEPLTSDTSTWYTGTGCGFKNGAYEMSEKEKDYYLMCSRDTNFTNYTYEVTVKAITGANNTMAGLLADSNNVEKTAYMFVVSKDGNSYGIYKHDEGAKQGDQFKILKENDLPTKISFPVRLGVKADDSELTFFVEGKKLTSIPRESSKGQIGTSILCGSSPSTADFINAKLWNL